MYMFHGALVSFVERRVIYMNANNSFSHLTLDERRIILTGITNGSSKTAIAQTIGKDKSTVGKEIKLHRSLTHKCKMPLECNNYITVNVHLEDSAPLIALNTSLLSVLAETDLLVPAMDVPTGRSAVLINIPILQRMLILIIGLF